MKAWHGLAPVFDEPNLVSHAGLVPVLALGEAAGLSEHVADKVTVPAANAAAKVRTLVAGMLAGADSIDDLDVLRSGGTADVVAGVRAPSTIGTFLRSFTHGHVLQLHAVNRALLGGLGARVPSLVGAGDLAFVDLDDTIGQVHGYAKQGAGFGYSGVRGLNALIATISTPTSAPVIAECSLRRGATRSGKGAAWHLRRALATCNSLHGAQVWVRGDAAFATAKNVTAAIKGGAWFSFTVPMWKTVTRAISQIPDEEWTPIRYPRAIRDEDTGELISDAHVAETSFVAFTSHPQAEQVTCRLIVRRVKRLGDAPAQVAGQGELFTTWRHHAFITNTTVSAVEADQHHRGHAIIEQVIAELKDGPLAHLPSGTFTANGAWLACTVIAFNLARAAAHAAGIAHARAASLRRKIIAVPARLAHTARRRLIHLPRHWPWSAAWTNLWHVATGPPAPAAT